jgi:dimethylargininase
MPIALTRSVPPSIVNCELTHLKREPINFTRAEEQHVHYEEGLTALGCTIQRFPALPDLPDSVFVEDTAVVLPELAIIARPGAASRRFEVTSVADALRPEHGLAFVERPGTLEGGDVLRIGATIYVGQSSRTNAEGIRQLAEIVSAHGYSVRPVKLSGCLHLKSAVTQVAQDVVLLNSAWVDRSSFRRLQQIEVHPGEPFAANALLIGETVIYSATYDETRQRLEKNGVSVHLVEVDELQKAEGGVTCCNILIPTDRERVVS